MFKLISVFMVSQILVISTCFGQQSKLDFSSQIGEYVREVFEDKKGRLWFGTLSDGVGQLDGTKLTYFSTKQGLAGNQINGIAEDAEGNLWFGTDGGVSKYDGISFKSFTVREGLSDNCIWSILVDRKGDVWVGTHRGVCLYQGSTFASFPIPKANVTNPASRFSTDVAWCIMEDSKGNIWFGTDGVGVCKFDGMLFSHFTQEDGLCNNNVRQVLEDKKGNLWFASWGTDDQNGGLSLFDGDSFKKLFSDEAGLSSANVSPIYEDKAGNIWIASMNFGVYRYDGKKLALFAETDRKELTVNLCIQSILEDSKGTMWFGFSGGLFRLNGSSFVNVTKDGPWK